MSPSKKFYDDLKEGEKQDEVTPTLAGMLQNAMKAVSQEMRVSMPGEVIRYDHKKQLVDVKPYFKRKYNDGVVQDSPIIYNVPLAIQRAGASFISMPVEKGHTVLLVFADRSLEKWLSNGEHGEPGDTRTHHLSDAIAYPGGYPFSNPAEVHNPNDVIVKNKNLEMRVKKNGKIQILNNKHELVRLIEDFMWADITGAHHKKKRIWTKVKTFVEK